MPVTNSYSDSIEQREDNRCRFLNTKYSNKRPLQRVKGSKVRGRILGRHTVQSQDHKNSTKLSHRSFCGGDQKQWLGEHKYTPSHGIAALACHVPHLPQ